MQDEEVVHSQFDRVVGEYFAFSLPDIYDIG